MTTIVSVSQIETIESSVAKMAEAAGEMDAAKLVAVVIETVSALDAIVSSQTLLHLDHAIAILLKVGFTAGANFDYNLRITINISIFIFF